MAKVVLLCGDRNWTDRGTIRAWIAKLQDWGYDTVVEGEARGADKIAREEAEAAGMNVIQVPASWELYGRAAGPIRNTKMLTYSPELVVAFHPDIEHSKGTRNMAAASRKDMPTQVRPTLSRPNSAPINGIATLTDDPV